MNYFLPYVKFGLELSPNSFPNLNDYGVFLRLQTHNGDNVPVGLYQDLAMQFPANSDGDFVAVWQDIYLPDGIKLTQSNNSRRPELKFVSGVPVVRFNGTGSYLSGAVFFEPGGAIGTVAYNVSDSVYSVWDTSPTNAYFSLSGAGSMGAMRNSRLSGYPSGMPTSGRHIFSINSFDSYQVFLDGAAKPEMSGAPFSGTGNILLGCGYDNALIDFSRALAGDVYCLFLGKSISYREKFENYIGNVIL